MRPRPLAAILGFILLFVTFSYPEPPHPLAKRIPSPRSVSLSPPLQTFPDRHRGGKGCRSERYVGFGRATMESSGWPTRARFGRESKRKTLVRAIDIETGKKEEELNDWEILGLVPVKLHHPDTGGSTEKFERIKDAFERLIGRRKTEPPASIVIDPLQAKAQPFVDAGMEKFDFDDLASAVREFDTAWDIWKMEGEPHHPLNQPLPYWVQVLAGNIIEIRKAVARDLAANGEWSAALIMYRNAQDMNEEVFNSDVTSIYILNQMAQIDDVLGRYNESVSKFEYVLYLIDSLPDRPHRGSVLANYASHYLRSGDFYRAIELYNEALESLIDEKYKEECIAAKTTYTLHPRKFQSEFYNQTANQDTAGELYKFETDPRKNHSRMTKVNEAITKVSKNVYNLCAGAMGEAMKNKTDFEMLGSIGHSILARVQDRGLAWGLCSKAWGLGIMQAGEDKEAEQILAESVEYLSSYLGNSLELADAVNLLGVIEYERGNEDAAYGRFMTAYSILHKLSDGGETVDAAQIGSKIAVVLINRGDYEKALNFLARTLQTFLKILPLEDARIQNTRTLIKMAQNQMFAKEGPPDDSMDENTWLDSGWGPFQQTEDEKHGILSWSEGQVLDWAQYVGLEKETTDVLFKQKIDGPTLLEYGIQDMIQDGIPRGQAMKIRRFLDQGTFTQEREKPDKPPEMNPRPLFVSGDTLKFDETLTDKHLGHVLPAIYNGEKVSCKILPATLKGLQDARSNVRIPIHPNIERIIGIAGIVEHMILIYPYRSRGTVLEEYVGTEEGHLLSRDCLSFIRKIGLPTARAVRQMHAARIIHRDISARNLILNAKGEAMISAWEMARAGVKEYQSTNKETFPLRWLAPESIGGNFSQASDVWSMAVTWTEVLSQSQPYNGSSDAMVLVKVTAGRLHPQLPRELKGVYPRPFAQLLRQMCLRNPNERPSAAEVVRRLEFLEAKLAENSNYGINRSLHSSQDDETSIINGDTEDGSEYRSPTVELS
ncbi:hypothetical protein AAMO2058_000521000 [Amorphochlora amoebiformis]